MLVCVSHGLRGNGDDVVYEGTLFIEVSELTLQLGEWILGRWQVIVLLLSHSKIK